MDERREKVTGNSFVSGRFRRDDEEGAETASRDFGKAEVGEAIEHGV